MSYAELQAYHDVLQWMVDVRVRLAATLMGMDGNAEGMVSAEAALVLANDLHKALNLLDEFAAELKPELLKG